MWIYHEQVQQSAPLESFGIRQYTRCTAHVRTSRPNWRSDSISFPESTFPLSSGTGNKRLWDKAFSDNRILVIPVELRRRERVFQDGLLAESAYSSTFHKAIEFSLKKLGKPKLELRREQYDAIRAICFERKDALAVLPTGFRKSLIYREFLTTFEAAVSLNVVILLCLLCHPEADL